MSPFQLLGSLSCSFSRLIRCGVENGAPVEQQMTISLRLCKKKVDDDDRQIVFQIFVG